MLPVQYDYIQIVKLLENFSNEHLMLKRFASDFQEQFNNKCTTGNTYPFMYAAPLDGTAGVNVSTYRFRVYVVDQIQKDRSNIDFILNDTSFILGNLRVYLSDINDDVPVITLNDPTVIPLNNFGVDFLAGHYMDFEVEYDSPVLCDIPFDNSPVVSGWTCDINYTNDYLTCSDLPLCPTIIQIEEDIAALSGGAFQNYYTTGATLVGTTAVFNRNDLVNAYSLQLSGLTSGLTFTNTAVQNGLNTYTGGTALNPTVNISGGTVNNWNITGGTLMSGGTDLYNIFLTTADGNDITRVQPGLNIYTGGTPNFPTVNMSAATLVSLSATTISGGTYYSGSTSLITIINSLITGATPVSQTQYWTSGSTGISSIKAINSTSVNATGSFAVAQGEDALASGNNGSHAEGFSTIAGGTASHAEGYNTQASGPYGAHSEGLDTIAAGQSSHAEGVSSISYGTAAHSEGRLSNAFTDFSHAEGNNTISYGTASHAEGSGTTAGVITLGVVYGDASHAEGSKTVATGTTSHAEGMSTVAAGHSSHAEGNSTLARGDRSHAEGNSTQATGANAHAEGNSTNAAGDNSHAEGASTTASGNASHVEGEFSQATNRWAHAEGVNTLASGDFGAHSEGSNTTASAAASHAEGILTVASGAYSHAGGALSTASGLSSFSHGSGNTASGAYTTVGGGQSNRATAKWAVIGGGRHNLASNYDTFIGGGQANSATTAYATVTGGLQNLASGLLSFINGGFRNRATATYSAIGGGKFNVASGFQSTVNGGYMGTASGYGSVINGGSQNYSTGRFSTVAGGNINRASGQGSAVLAGSGNTASGRNTTIVAGADITATNNDTAYVPYLNIRNVFSATSVINLGLDASGNVVTGTTASPFTGGSSSCIADLYVTNFHGCSPMTFHDPIRVASGATISGNTTFITNANASVLIDTSTAVGQPQIQLRDGSLNVAGNISTASNNMYFDAPLGKFIIRNAPGITSTFYNTGQITFNDQAGAVENAQVTINNSAAAQVGLQIRAAASQTANIQEWENSTGGTLSYIDNLGRFSASAVTATTYFSGSTPLTTVIVNLIPKIKASGVTFSSFSGVEPSYTVVFATPFSDANYSPTIQGGDIRSWSAGNIAASGFTIYSNSTQALTGTTYWTATKFIEN